MGARPTTGGGGWEGDTAPWNVWWHFNKDPYLDLKSHVHASPADTGGDGNFLGHAEAARRRALRPTEEQIRLEIVPALLRALENETNNDVITSCLVALGKIGEGASSEGEARIESVVERFLADKNQEISESAAIALGILASPDSIETLAALLRDTAASRELVGRSEVHYRTRAFAAYGLALIGARHPGQLASQRIVILLNQAIAADNTASMDLKVACINAIGLVPLEGLARLAEVDALLALLEDEELPALVRAHCPAALGRLVPGLLEERREVHRQRVAAVLLRFATAESESAELVQGSVQALGLLGTNDGENALDRRIRAALCGSFRDQQAQRFALVALAKVGARMGSAQPEDGAREAASFLLAQLGGGRSELRAWAGLACGVLARGLADAESSMPVIGSLKAAVRLALQEERDPHARGALAISCGIMRATDAAPVLLRLLDEERVDEARGHVAIALGLIDSPEALPKIHEIVDESRFRPELLQRSAIALGLMEDKDAVPKLVRLLAEARSLATQASVSSALGFIGDQRSVEPLIAMLRNTALTERARAFAAVALGIVADKESLPWNAKLAQDVDYRAAPATLTDPAGTGILDIL
jgi:HEAT repeat protein